MRLVCDHPPTEVRPEVGGVLFKRLDAASTVLRCGVRSLVIQRSTVLGSTPSAPAKLATVNRFRASAARSRSLAMVLPPGPLGTFPILERPWCPVAAVLVSRLARQPGHMKSSRSVPFSELAFDPRVPNVARIYDFLLRGKDNFAADREAAERLLETVPDAARAARDNRQFLGRAVWFLAREAGIRQFLDIEHRPAGRLALSTRLRSVLSRCRVLSTLTMIQLC